MDILHVISSLDPQTAGTQASTLRLAAAQAMLGHGVAIVSYDLPEPQRSVLQAQIQSVPYVDRVSMMHLPAHKSGGVSRAGRRQLKGLIAAAQVVHLHGIWDPLYKTAGKIARRLGVAYVVRPCGSLEPEMMQQHRWRRKLALTLGYRRLINKAIFLHMSHTDEGQSVRPLRLKTPFAVIPNGVFVEEFEPRPPQGTFHAKHPQLQGKPYILFLGRLDYRKGLDLLGEAYSLMTTHDAHTQLVIAGPDFGAKDMFDRKIAHWALGHRVHLIGPLFGRDKAAAISDAICVSLTSRSEGFSMAITEALACGVPVVISDRCHFREVQDYGAGVIVPLHLRAISDALLRIVNNETTRVQMGQMGRQLIAARYTWPRLAQQCIAAYEQGIRGTR